MDPKLKIKPVVLKSFRLIEFRTLDDCPKDGSASDSGSENGSLEYKSKTDDNQFVIQMFGINERGETCCLYIQDFQPFFYIKVGKTWTKGDMTECVNELKNKLDKRFRESVLEWQLVDYQKLYGFTGGKKDRFIKITFKNSTVMKKMSNLWYSYKKGPEAAVGDGANGNNGRGERVKTNYVFKGTELELYESNIPPLLRYFHIHNISPSGWVSFKLNRAIKTSVQTTTCKYEYIIPLKELMPQAEKEARVPYKICSFDIEANSSHGDFPLAIKSYKRFAQQMVDAFLKQSKIIADVDKLKMLVSKLIYSAFGYDRFEDIDLVYPKIMPNKHKVKNLITTLLDESLENAKKANKDEDNSKILKIDTMFEQMKNFSPENTKGTDDGGEDGEGEGVEDSGGGGLSYGNWQKKPKVKKTDTIMDVLMNDSYDRDEKVNISNEVLTRLFPRLEGDKVTFIGSTFLRYGEKEPYLNHCLVLDTCDKVDGVEIESVDTERDLLLKWTEIIARENPDIIIGFNTFGFDNEFLFRRAQENECDKEFLLLSRKIDELAATSSYDDPTELHLEVNKLKIASGEFDMRYFKMTGRLQLDLYAYFRKENFNFSSYKLDDIAGDLISDNITNIVLTENICDGEKPVTELYSQNLMGLNVGDYIRIGFVGFTADYYKDGKKFQVVEIRRNVEITETIKGVETKKTHNVIVIGGHETIDRTKPIKWGMAKDDVNHKDIFRLSNGSAADRAIVAKYCIQDCNLVHHLMNKTDVLTGFIEMANICSVPISFLIFRGQGIKLTSYVAKKCREKGILMPDLEKTKAEEGFEGAIVLPPKCAMYMDNPVACVDYSSLYPSSMISQNFSHDSKVWSKEYDLVGNLIKVTGERNSAGQFVYDNLPGYYYIDMEFDTFDYIRKKPTARAVKTKVGRLVCRWAQFPENKKGVMPSILEELLKARADTRKLIKTEKDPFMQNILDKRQNAYKVTANSLYGQCGSRTSQFYEKDVAASTTATGRMMIMYAKRMIEEVYGDAVYETAVHGPVKCKAEYVYGDSVANYTPIYIRVKGTFDICTIENLAEKYGNNNWTQCLEEGKQEKEICELIDVETWTEKGWTKLYRVIRHALAAHKKMIRILTHTGLVDVTDDHSLITKDGAEISPKDVKIGTELLHNQLPPSINADNGITVETAKIMGFFFGDGSCGEYNCPSGKKHSWALNNASMDVINKYLGLCAIGYPDFEWRCMDTLESSHVYKISPKCSKYGAIADFVKMYRGKMYYNKAKIIPVEIMSANLEIREAFWEGLYDADSDKDENGYVRIDQKNQISASHICWLAASLGYKTSLNTRKDKPDIYRVTMTKKTQRKNPNAIKKLIEIPYEGFVYDLTTENHHFAAGIGNMIVHNTDSVFFTFNLENPKTGEKIRGKPALEATIELAQDAADLCTRYLKPPMALSYEKTLMPFILLSKKRYVGMLYETDPNKGKLKFMGLALKRRDSCDYLKDVYGGILKILMDTKNENGIKSSIDYLDGALTDLVKGQIPMDKLTITKQLRGYYKNPNQIAHKVLADRIGKRDAGNKPKPGDRMKFVHIVNDSRGVLQGDKIETPEYIIENKLPLDYDFYVTNQLMKPIQQLFGLALEQIWELQNKRSAIKAYQKDIARLEEEYPEIEVFMKQKEKYCAAKVKVLLFDKILTQINQQKNKMQAITSFFLPVASR